MAKIKRSKNRFSEESRVDAAAELRIYFEAEDGVNRSIPQELLESFPGNADLTGSLSPVKRARVREDILANGIREPLQVWPSDGKLYVVSGNERLSIIREMTDAERERSHTENLPVVIKKFSNWPQARIHLMTVNENRKSNVSNPVLKMQKIWPVAENPWIYADLRTRSLTVSSLKCGREHFKLETPVDTVKAREMQRDARGKVREATGWGEDFLKSTISKVLRSFSSEAGQAPELTVQQKKQLEKARKTREQIVKKIENENLALADLKNKIASMKIELRTVERSIKRLTGVDPRQES